MLKLLKKTIKITIGIIILIIFNKGIRYVIKIIKTIGNLFYSYYIGAEIKQIGDGYLFEYPFVLKGGKYIKIGKRFSTRARFRIEAWDYHNGNLYNPEIIIGDSVVFNFNCHVGAINKIQIGNNVLIGSNVLITDHNHGEITKDELNIITYLRPLYSKGPVIIEDNVWIGEGVAILPNVRIGKNSIIGANSVVNIDIPDNCVAGGIPARVIKQFN
jgi:acetyltransferase-like isoleucine patch superfamily enzyme